MRHLPLFALALLCAAPAVAQQPACPATPAPPPAALAGWATRGALAAAADTTGLGRALLTPGRAADVTLHPLDRVTFPVAPAKAGAADSHGGLIGLSVARPGTYRIALGSPAWIEVAQGARAVSSTAHGHGPACTGIAKLVDFPLRRGRYVLEISGAKAAAVALMVVRVE